MEAMPSYFTFCTAQDFGQFFTLSARKGTKNPFSQVDYGETLLFITTSMLVIDSPCTECKLKIILPTIWMKWGEK
ncbi:hypothetical protein PVK06_013225 [Gossypium arboreum]|uniref:Uncharacterized protein n=1 Tax=Gossypium arboreum TaxID=29729 RepID=A0ABR0QDM6_GOSAR|nr:hypothetical protein PVK06_013225 [Gossypium arboreum]